jgi:hypothetical protein
MIVSTELSARTDRRDEIDDTVTVPPDPDGGGAGAGAGAGAGDATVTRLVTLNASIATIGCPAVPATMTFSVCPPCDDQLKPNNAFWATKVLA